MDKPYGLGVDVGTTFTAAAVSRGEGATTMVTLGTRTPEVPSVVLARADNSLVSGDAAERGAVAEPGRVARGFKRRVGDDVPVILGGTPWAPHLLMGQMLRDVVAVVTAAEGGPPAAVTLTHPATWGPFKLDRYRQAAEAAGVAGVSFVAEPVAAAAHYSEMERVDAGATLAVFDLGGGTFDAAVVRRGPEGAFGVLGQPVGLEQVGGIDVDDAVLAHVRNLLGERAALLESADAATLALLRADCVAAKEALSVDPDATVRVALEGGIQTVRVTRSELEYMVRPVLVHTVDALARALQGAGVQPAELQSVLLVGGGSRMPLVAELVTSRFGRPVAVDIHPKHAVALGAAEIAFERLAPAAAPAAPAAAPVAPAAAPVAPAPAASAAFVAAPPAAAPVVAPPPAPAPVASAPAPAPPALAAARPVEHRTVRADRSPVGVQATFSTNLALVVGAVSVVLLLAKHHDDASVVLVPSFPVAVIAWFAVRKQPLLGIGAAAGSLGAALGALLLGLSPDAPLLLDVHADTGWLIGLGAVWSVAALGACARLVGAKVRRPGFWPHGLLVAAAAVVMFTQPLRAEFEESIRVQIGTAATVGYAVGTGLVLLLGWLVPKWARAGIALTVVAPGALVLYGTRDQGDLLNGGKAAIALVVAGLVVAAIDAALAVRESKRAPA